MPPAKKPKRRKPTFTDRKRMRSDLAASDRPFERANRLRLIIVDHSPAPTER